MIDHRHVADAIDAVDVVDHHHVVDVVDVVDVDAGVDIVDIVDGVDIRSKPTSEVIYFSTFLLYLYDS
jgi:hypothetical protein